MSQLLSDPMFVSFVIPHKGRTEYLKATIDSIFTQEGDLSQVEIIVVSQEQQLENIYENKVNCPKVKVIYRPQHETISALRNIGVKASQGQYLALIDADIKLDPNWLGAMFVELQSKQNRMLVSAVQRCETDAPTLEKIRTALSNISVDCSLQFLPGRNLFLKRTVFDKVGGFPEHLVTCEDYYFTDKVHQLGELYYTSRSAYLHLGEDKTHSELFKKEIWRGKSNLQSLRGRSVSVNEYPSILVPIWIFFFSLLLVLGLVSLKKALVLFGVVMIMLPITLYSMRLYNRTKTVLIFIHIFCFYSVYFSARTIGTIRGFFEEVWGYIQNRL